MVPGIAFFLVYFLVLAVLAGGLACIGKLLCRTDAPGLACRILGGGSLVSALGAVGMLAAGVVFMLARNSGWFTWYP